MGIQAGVDRGDQAHRRQRIPTQIEKRVVDPDALDTEYLGVDAGQDLLDRVGRGAIMITILVLRCRQGALVEFAVDRQWQRVDRHHRGRHHVRGEPLGQRGADLGRVCCPGDIAHQAFVAGAVLANDHHRLLDPIEPGQGRLHFTEFDAIAADLDLFIGASQILQLTISAPPHQVPGAIHACSRRSRAANRAGHKPRRGQTAPPPIPIPHAGTGYIQLTDHTRRHCPQPLVQHKKAKMRQRPTNRAGMAVGVAVDDLPERGMHRRLGRAIHVDQAR